MLSGPRARATDLPVLEFPKLSGCCIDLEERRTSPIGTMQASCRTLTPNFRRHQICLGGWMRALLGCAAVRSQVVFRAERTRGLEVDSF
jgi:hypothetical protein